MTTTTQDLTLENYTERTGKRFRVSPDQNARIKAGSLTREQAFQEYITRVDVEGLKKTVANAALPVEFWQEAGLTLENFGERAKALTGQVRRFRVSPDQRERIKAGTLTREGAFAETLATKVNV